MRLEYADDVNILLRQKEGESKGEDHQNTCACARCRIEKVMESLPGHFADHKMQLNAGKTVYADISVKRCTLDTILGNNIEGSIEIEKRKAKAAIAFNGMWQLWKKNVPVTTDKKMKIYNGLVKPFYIHSAGSLVLKRTELDKLDAHHRKQLRRLLGIFYPAHISNERLYEETSTRPISVEIAKARWTLMGHILRRAKDEIPAYQAMEAHFRRRESQTDTPRNKTRRGRLLTTIPRLIQLDIQKLKNKTQRLNLFGTSELDCGTHLLLLKAKSENRVNWSKIVKFIEDYELEAWKAKNRTSSAQRAQRNEANPNRVPTRGTTRGRPRGSRGPPRGRGRPRGSRGRNRPRGTRGSGGNRTRFAGTRFVPRHRGDEDAIDTHQEHLNRLRMELDHPDEQRRKRAEDELRRITNANQEFLERSENKNGH
jgi:hypothetical protein